MRRAGSTEVNVQIDTLRGRDSFCHNSVRTQDTDSLPALAQGLVRLHGAAQPGHSFRSGCSTQLLIFLGMLKELSCSRSLPWACEGAQSLPDIGFSQLPLLFIFLPLWTRKLTASSKPRR